MVNLVGGRMGHITTAAAAITTSPPPPPPLVVLFIGVYWGCIEGGGCPATGVLVRLWCASCSHASPEMERGGILGRSKYK